MVPGTEIPIAHELELRDFENWLAPFVDPEYRQDLWEKRWPPTADLLKPKGFHGRLVDIALTVMDEPYKRIIDAPERDWVFMRGVARRARDSEIGRPQQAHYHGFTLEARMRSANPRRSGWLHNEIWYAPLPRYIIARGNYGLQADTARGEGLKRFVTHPRYERLPRSEPVVQTIGFQALKSEISG